MDKELQVEARKQYFSYFRFWFAAVGVVLVFFLAGLMTHLTRATGDRRNDRAPVERVYDQAEVLTEEEEEQLRKQIAKAEKQIACDIVLVTIRQEMGEADYDWEYHMSNLADNFYDENNFGFNKVHGDGVLLLDNWYEGQAGSWLSTCGRVYEEFGTYEINEVLDAVYDKVEIDPYAAYSTYVDKMVRLMSIETVQSTFPVGLLVLPVVIMLIFVAVKMRSSFGKDTVVATTYVAGGRPDFKDRSDQLINKFVTKRKIPQNNSSSGGRSVSRGSSGRGGGHVSRGGVSHGGGGRRR